MVSDSSLNLYMKLPFVRMFEVIIVIFLLLFYPLIYSSSDAENSRAKIYKNLLGSRCNFSFTLIVRVHAISTICIFECRLKAFRWQTLILSVEPRNGNA